MNDVYERLRERLDKFPQGFPETESRVEITILKQLFTPDEAELALSIKPLPEPVAAIADRAGKDPALTERMLYDMSKKGVIFRLKLGDVLYYNMIPWMIGIWEFQLNRLDQDNIRLYEQFYEEGLVPYRKDLKHTGIRVIPIEDEVITHKEVQSYEKVSEILNSNDRFAVADCICRKERSMMGKGCGKLMESCLVFGLGVDYFVENGLAREISREEAQQILRKAEEEGLIHMSSNHAGQKGVICNCCGCCCKALAYTNRHGIRNAMGKSNYCAELSEATCTICGACIERCQVYAIKEQNGRVVIDMEKCIGCGLCSSSCPAGSLSLRVRKTGDLPHIFRDSFEAVNALGSEKNKVFPFD